ncbi:conjugal transfer protein TraF, partial [Sphingomonas ginsenosidimutans]
MLPADRLIRSASARRLVLWGGLGAGALALSSLAAFAQGHALMINVSPSLPYWALWVTRGAAVHRGD